MTTPDAAKKLATLLKKLKGVTPLPEPLPEHAPSWLDPAVEELVFSMLVWEARTPQAREAIHRIRAGVVDYNELRVCFPEEIRAMLGERYPRGAERAARLRAALNDLYKREHRVTLQAVLTAGKRDARQYLETLDGVPPFAAARTFLVLCAGHAAPVDERIRNLLAEEGVVAPTDEPEAVSSWLERQLKAGDAANAYSALQAAADEPARKPAKGAKEPRNSGEKPARAAPRKKAGKG
ncbi:MAG: hypothetical protein JNL50_13370 [Phycisphaerae bacterium]|nr:hypothetical protein [Phycisphaerae bacterium]